MFSFFFFVVVVVVVVCLFSFCFCFFYFLIEKNYLPIGSKVFPLRADPFSERDFLVTFTYIVCVQGG